jgi:SAM-dependent methyltransferase
MAKKPSLRLLSQDFLAERLVPEMEVDTVQYFDHVRRYQFAQQYVYNRRVLDIACGTGYGSDILIRGGARLVVGADISPAALDYAGQHWPGFCFVRADARNIPLANGAVDVVVSFETLEHLADPRAFLAEVKRVLATGGCLILSTPNRTIASPTSSTPFSPYHVFEPTRAELLTLLRDAGWQVLSLHGITHSRRIQAILRPVGSPFRREPSKIAWSAYVRLAVRAALPPVLYRWLGRLRHIPALAITDSILKQEASEDDAYFVAVCTAEQS